MVLTVAYGDDAQATMRDYINHLTLSRLLGFGDTSIVYGRYDGDDGDDGRIGDDDDDEKEQG